MLVTAIRNWRMLAGAAAGAIVGSLLVLGWTMAVTVPAAREEGREIERADALRRSMEIIRERSSTNEAVGRMSDAELCAALDGRWVPDGQPRCQ
jgi:hypothetical protein